MPQASGHINPDGSIQAGSRNFSVSKQQTGTYWITVNGSGGNFIVTLAARDYYLTAQAVIGANGDNQTFEVKTGYTDQGDKNPMDLQGGFNFIAIWE